MSVDASKLKKGVKIRLETGEVQWRVAIGAGAIPAAAAVPLGGGRLLATLWDGSVVQCVLPQNVADNYARAQP